MDRTNERNRSMVSVRMVVLLSRTCSFCYLNKNGSCFSIEPNKLKTPAFQQIRARYPELAVLSAYLAYFLKGEEHNG